MDPCRLARAIDDYAALGGGAPALRELRVRYAEMFFALCSDDEMPARLRAFAEEPGYSVYLVAGGEHCPELTDDPGRARGLVFAETG